MVRKHLIVIVALVDEFTAHRIMERKHLIVTVALH